MSKEVLFTGQVLDPLGSGGECVCVCGGGGAGGGVGMAYFRVRVCRG